MYVILKLINSETFSLVNKTARHNCTISLEFTAWSSAASGCWL